MLEILMRESDVAYDDLDGMKIDRLFVLIDKDIFEYECWGSPLSSSWVRLKLLTSLE